MPSGAAIAFWGDAAGSPELYQVNVDGSNLTRLTYGWGFRGNVSWSPDGARIAFDCGTTIRAIDADGTNLITLTTSFSFATTAMFSPAGGPVAFLTGGWSGYGDLVVQGPDGTIVRVAPGVVGTTPRWSADGGSLAFVREGHDGSGGACNADGSPCGPPDETLVVNADGTGLRVMGYGHNPEWFVPAPGLPVATFTHDCTGAACQFNAAGSFDPDGSIRRGLR